MLNQVVLVGRLVDKAKLIKTENAGGKYAVITLATPRSFKNADGVYETDFIKCTLWGNVAENTAEWCNKGDLIGIRGRIQSNEDKMEIIAEKVTFLSSKKVDEE